MNPECNKMKRVFVMKAVLFFASALILLTTAQSFSQKDSMDIKIGQMLMVGFRGFTIDPTMQIVDDIKSGRVGGVILFDYDVPLKKAERNIRDATQVKKLTAQLQSHTKIALLIAVDQEGGKIARLKEKYGFPRSVSQQYLGRIDDEDTTRTRARETAKLFRSMWLNMNMAPVLDVNVNPDNPIIGKLERSFSSDPDVVTKHARWMLEEFRDMRILAAAKHFPGHGSSRSDSHLGFVDVTETYRMEELDPYRLLIQEKKLGCIMTAHVLNAHLDAEYPATLSKKVIQNLLRDSLGFDGVVISDDMGMKAITEQYGLEQAIVLAINAGVDLLVFGNNLTYDELIAKKAVKIIRENVEAGKIPSSRIEESYRRIMKLKKFLDYDG